MHTASSLVLFNLLGKLQGPIVASDNQILVRGH